MEKSEYILLLCFLLCVLALAASAWPCSPVHGKGWSKMLN